MKLNVTFGDRHMRAVVKALADLECVITAGGGTTLEWNKYLGSVVVNVPRSQMPGMALELFAHAKENALNFAKMFPDADVESIKQLAAESVTPCL